MTNPYEPPKTKPAPRLQFPRARLLLFRLMDGELSSIMAPIFLVAGVLFLFWSIVGVVNGYLLAAGRNSVAALMTTLGTLRWWEIGCFFTALLSFASARVWWRREIVKAVVLSAVTMLLGASLVFM